MRVLGVLLSVLLVCCRSFAGNVTLETATDPRAVAMGDAAVALGGGILLSDGNPALLGWIDGMQFEGLAPVAKGFDADSRLWQVGVASPPRKEPFYAPAVGVLFRDYELVAAQDDLRATYAMDLSSFLLAAPIGEDIALGAAVRRIGVIGLSGWYVDLGFAMRYEVFTHGRVHVESSVGVAARRLGRDVEELFFGAPSKAPGIETLGAVSAAPVNPEMAWGGTLSTRVNAMRCTLALQVVDPMQAGTSGDLYSHAGVEIALGRWAALRAGIIDDEDFDQRFTYGAGVRVPVASRWAVGTDYAREPALPIRGLSAANAPDASHFVSLRIEYVL